jgi:hypothetical protein
MNDLQGRARASTGLGPGRLRLYDASAVMLQVVAARVAPDAAAALGSHLLALHRATEAAAPDYWTKVQAEAQQVQKAADALIPILAQHNFDKTDAMALAKALVASGIDGVDLDYSGAQQQTMALESVIAGMKSLGFADDAQIKGLNGALGGLYQVVANDQAYRPDAFAAALRQLGTKLPQQ